jgi:hypothetical protein
MSTYISQYMKLREHNDALRPTMVTRNSCLISCKCIMGHCTSMDNITNTAKKIKIRQTQYTSSFICTNMTTSTTTTQTCHIYSACALVGYNRANQFQRMQHAIKQTSQHCLKFTIYSHASTIANGWRVWNVPNLNSSISEQCVLFMLAMSMTYIMI